MNSPIEALKNIVKRLRAPDGCPWDIEQTPQTLTRHIIEEAYELVDAIEQNETNHIMDELSDQLLHVVMISEMMKESNKFTFDDVANHCVNKMIRRHPHVFGSTAAKTTSDVEKNWEQIKASEKSNNGTLDGIPQNMPALMVAEKIQKRAASVGFDWPDESGPINKLKEEYQELIEAETKSEINEEIGDILFTIVNICRKHNVSAEILLKKANQKFKDRFVKCETIAKLHKTPLETLSIEELEVIWDQAKKL